MLVKLKIDKSIIILDLYVLNDEVFKCIGDILLYLYKCFIFFGLVVENISY